MDNNGHLPSTKSDDSKWALIEQAMEIYYSGNARSITKAVEQIEGLARSTYYSYQEKFPSEFLLLEQSVQAAAVDLRRSKELAFANEQLDRSVVAQRKASEAVLELIPMWKSIAMGEVRTVTSKGKDGKEIKKDIIPYPRDQMEASKALLSVSRDGMRPEHGQALAGTQPVQAEEQKQLAPPEKAEIALVPGLVASDFTKVTATRADGVSVEFSVSRPVDGEIVDVEPEQ
jgi:hypothetical protein